jgi:hypothetical protein
MIVGHGSIDKSTWLAAAIHDARSRPHRNLRRRRLHLMSIDRHHAQEQAAFGRTASAG